MRTKQELLTARSEQPQPLDTQPDSARPDITRAVTRGARRALSGMGLASLVEVTLKSGRRADILAFDKAGQITIVEVKSSTADYSADNKWHDYLEFCDRFFFAVPDSFPQSLIPEACGLMVADAYEALVVREPVETPLVAARRRSVMLMIARLGANRLHLLADPGLMG